MNTLKKRNAVGMTCVRPIGATISTGCADASGLCDGKQQIGRIAVLIGDAPGRFATR